jgi:transposase
MGGRIPQPVRLEVIRMWLRGYSRDEIAKDVGIGTGTVSGILQQCRQDDADFDLLRGVALELRDRGMRVEDYAPLLRLKSLLEEKEVRQEISQNENLFSEYKRFEAINYFRSAVFQTRNTYGPIF